MWRHTAVWFLVVAVLGVGLFAGCGKSKKSEETEPQAMAPPPRPGERPGAYGPMRPGMPGEKPGAYGPEAMQPAPTQAAKPEEPEPSGPSYRERYEQGELTAEELREERELQKLEKELGYPVGP